MEKIQKNKGLAISLLAHIKVFLMLSFHFMWQLFMNSLQWLAAVNVTKSLVALKSSCIGQSGGWLIKDYATVN